MQTIRGIACGAALAASSSLALGQAQAPGYAAPPASHAPAPVVGAHYPVTDASIIGQYRDLIKGLQVRVAELKREGKSSDETGELLRNEFRLKYPDWAQPLRVHAAATRIYAELQ